MSNYSSHKRFRKATSQDSFVQERGRFCCGRQHLQDKISEDKGFTCRCRDPKCSFQCHEHWARKESAICTRCLRDLPDGYAKFRGNLTMPPNATPADHDVAIQIFERVFKASEKKLGRTIRFRAIPHDTDVFERHYDFIAYGDRVSLKTMKRIVKAAAKKAGFIRSTTRPISTPAQIRGGVDYAHKTDYTKSNGQYQYLPAKDGKHLVWGSKKFFIFGKTKKEIWKELKAEWALKRSNKLLNVNPHKPQKPPPDLLLEIASYLPDREQDAVKPAFIDWLTGCDMGGKLMEELLLKIPNIEVDFHGGYYAPRNYGNHPQPERKPYFARIFGQRTPYHADYCPRFCVERDTYEWQPSLVKKV